jgi:NitT/TauT family transport system permease protein
VFFPNIMSAGRALRPNRWDLIAIPIVLSLIALVAWGSREMAAPYQPGQSAGTISLAVWHLPEYALRSVLRMAIALVLSALFTLAIGALAAKSRRAETVIVPALDILQSVPILGFLSITVAGFVALFRGNLLGVECAAIFAIFTSQVWNMTFSFYQSLKVVPQDLEEASRLFGLSPAQRFWKLEVPFAMPGLIWNTMMSVSGGWFFVVASEVIAVGIYDVSLPGIGSYVALAIQDKDLAAVGYALLAMFIVILAYDQLLFRPLVAWSEKFRLGDVASQYEPRSWVLNLFRQTRALRNLVRLTRSALFGAAGTLNRVPRRPGERTRFKARPRARRFAVADLVLYAMLLVVVCFGLFRLVETIHGSASGRDIVHVSVLGTYTLARVLILIAAATLIWVPVGVYIGLRPRLAVRVQPVAQFLAAFPANLLFPVAVVVIVFFDLTPEVFTAPLMILGTQWYILFNVIAGASAIPNDLREAAATLNLSRRQQWRTLYLPGIFPYLVTGLITASGGTWNASIVAEVVSWGDDTLTATGLGSYIAEATVAADYGKILLGIVVMSAYVVGLNRLVWRRLYRIAETRYRLG